MCQTSAFGGFCACTESRLQYNDCKVGVKTHTRFNRAAGRQQKNWLFLEMKSRDSTHRTHRICDFVGSVAAMLVPVLAFCFL